MRVMPGLARRADQAAQAQRQRSQGQVLLDVQLQRLAEVLAELGGLAQAACVAGLGSRREAVDAIGGQHGLGGPHSRADQVAEGERRELETEFEHVCARTTAGTLRGLVELLLERAPFAVLW